MFYKFDFHLPLDSALKLFVGDGQIDSSMQSTCPTNIRTRIWIPRAHRKSQAGKAITQYSGWSHLCKYTILCFYQLLSIELYLLIMIVIKFSLLVGIISVIIKEGHFNASNLLTIPSHYFSVPSLFNSALWRGPLTLLPGILPSSPPPVQPSADVCIYFSPVILMRFVRKWRYLWIFNQPSPTSISVIFPFSHKHKPHISVFITGRLNVEVIFLNTKFKESLSEAILWFPLWGKA